MKAKTASATTSAAASAPAPGPAAEAPLLKLTKGKAAYYLGILWLLLFFDIAVRYAINPLFPLIQKDLHLSDGQLGMIGSAVLFGITAFIVPISYLSDRWSKSKVVSLMAFIWSACSIATGVAPSLPVMLAARTGVGVGAASYTPIAVSLISSWSQKSKWGKSFAIFNSAQPVAGCVGIVLAGFLASRYGWRPAILALSIPSLFLGLLALQLPGAKAGSGKALQMSLVRTAKTLAGNRSF